MRPVSLFVVALFAAAVGGCAGLPASPGADAPATSAADLDSLAYARPVSPVAARASAAVVSPRAGTALISGMVIAPLASTT